MKVDVTTMIGAVERDVRSGERDGRPTRQVVASRTYATSVDDVWDAISNPERLPRWFLPVSGELRLGGRYQLEGNAGGEIIRCAPPRDLGVTWEYGGNVSWLDVRLSAVEAGTQLELVHTAPVDPHWEQYGPGAAGVGWDMALMGLDLHLATGAANDPAEAMAWMASAEGKDFARHSGRHWGAAAVAAGEDPAAAQSAADRTAAFYTGEEAAADSDPTA